MKLAAALLFLVGAVSAARQEIAIQDVPASSHMGMKLLSKARRLDDAAAQNNGNGNQWDASSQYNQKYNQYNAQQQSNGNGGYNAYYNSNNNNGGQGYMDLYGDFESIYGQNSEAFQNYYMQMHPWVSDYSIKFQGCHHISEWNQQAGGQDDVRVWTRRLVKFRLCPSNQCSDGNSEGCSSGYGDYIIDLDTFLEAYIEAKSQYDEWMEEMAKENAYQYYTNNNNNDMDLSDYAQCQQVDINIELDENQNWNYYQYENQENIDAVYMGPYCASQGGAIYLGLFTDAKCTQAIDSSYGRSIYYKSTGESLPFSQTSLVQMTCFPCKEPDSNMYGYNYNNQGNDEQDEDDVCEACETLYTFSGKCEQHLPFSRQNNNACNYLEGIKVIRKDGTVVTTNRAAGGSKKGQESYKAAFAFVGIFSAAFVLLSAYVYYLKEKLDRASIQLVE